MQKSILSQPERYTNETLGKLLERMIAIQLEIKAALDQLISSAKSGGGIVPAVDYVKMDKWRQKYGKKLALKCWKKKIKVCKEGVCRYGPKQALKCFEALEAIVRRRKKRREFKDLMIKHKGFPEKYLRDLQRKELLMVCSVVGSNIPKLLKKKGRGNEPLIESILKRQDRFIRQHIPIQLSQDNQENITNESQSQQETS